MRCIATLAVACAVPLTAQHAYLDKISAAPGETVQVFASIPGATSVSVARSHYFGLETQLLDSGPLAGGTQPAAAGRRQRGASGCCAATAAARARLRRRRARRRRARRARRRPVERRRPAAAAAGGPTRPRTRVRVRRGRRRG